MLFTSHVKTTTDINSKLAVWRSRGRVRDLETRVHFGIINNDGRCCPGYAARAEDDRCVSRLVDHRAQAQDLVSTQRGTIDRPREGRIGIIRGGLYQVRVLEDIIVPRYYRAPDENEESGISPAAIENPDGELCHV